VNATHLATKNISVKNTQKTQKSGA